MGLLERARSLKNDPDRSSDPGFDEIASSLILGFSYTAEHVDFPYGLFSAIQTLIGFAKGLLLLPDPLSGEYLPWVTRGFDRTTTRRMRLPADTPILTGWGSGFLREISADEIRPMLSNREHGLTDRLMMLRFEKTEPLPALMIFDHIIGNEPVLIRALEGMLERLGPGIEHSRRLTIADPQDEEIPVGDWLTGWGDQEGRLAMIDLNGVMEKFLTRVPGMERYRAVNDAVNLARRITGRMGRFHNLGDGRILLMFPPNRLTDTDLFLHQFANSFETAYRNLEEQPHIPASFWSWPSERKSVEQVLPPA